MVEMPSVYGMEQRTARKEHKCCECRGKILPGEKYNYHHGIWEGRAGSFKVCLECDAIRKEVDKNERDPEFRTAFEGLSESVFDSHNAKFIRDFIAVKQRRGAAISDWMLRRRDELTAPQGAS